MMEKPLVTVSGQKILFNSSLHQRLTQDLPQEGLEWRRRLDNNSKLVYIDVDFVDFDVDNVERASERLSRLALSRSTSTSPKPKNISPRATSLCETNNEQDEGSITINCNPNDLTIPSGVDVDRNSEVEKLANSANSTNQDELEESERHQNEVSQAFFNQKLLGRPILHTYWADKTDFENENQKSQFDEWIGKVQASTCTEWAIVIIEEGDFKAQLGTALFKSKLQSSTSQANTSSSSVASLSQTSSTTSFLDRMKKGLSTMFQSDSNSERWLTLINQDRAPDSRVNESYSNFLKKFRNIIMASFSKQIELFEEQLRVRRDMRTDKSWDFFSYFSMQEELAFAFEFLTLFDEALLQYDLLDALYSEYISSAAFNSSDEPLYEQWTSFNSWEGLCLDLNSAHSKDLRQRIVEKKASLLDLRNYLFAKQCDLMLMQNQPWRVAASTSIFLQNCLREHQYLKIDVKPGALNCWTFISALEVLQKCECYSCTSTMENYSLHTVDIWNCARKKLLELGSISHQMPNMPFGAENAEHIAHLLAGLGPDPHGGVSYQNNEISPQARLKDALAGREQFSKHLIEISELTLGTYKHIGRKRHALLVGKELADFYMAQSNFTNALPFLIDLEKNLRTEKWEPLLEDVQKCILRCDTALQTNQEQANEPISSSN